MVATQGSVDTLKTLLNNDYFTNNVDISKLPGLDTDKASQELLKTLLQNGRFEQVTLLVEKNLKLPNFQEVKNLRGRYIDSFWPVYSLEKNKRIYQNKAKEIFKQHPCIKDRYCKGIHSALDSSGARDQLSYDLIYIVHDAKKSMIKAINDRYVNNNAQEVDDKATTTTAKSTTRSKSLPAVNTTSPSEAFTLRRSQSHPTFGRF
ncbi:MAG: hypothetical protein AAF195_03085 [Pseudomonadota bacterium]